MARVTAVNISEKKGVRKHEVPYIDVKCHHGIVGATELEVTQIGKQCHNDCEIKKATGKCVMPTEGIFAVVIKEGRIRPGDEIEVLK